MIPKMGKNKKGKMMSHRMMMMSHGCGLDGLHSVRGEIFLLNDSMNETIFAHLLSGYLKENNKAAIQACFR